MKKWNELVKTRMKESGVTQDKLAEHIGVSQGAVAHWLSGRREPTLEVIDRVLQYLGLPRMTISLGQEAHQQAAGASKPQSNATMLGPISVWDDDTPLDPDEVYVPFLKEVELSAGSGRTIVTESSSRKLRFGKHTLRNQGVQPDQAVCVTVHGNSMEPVLPDGSTVGVDRAATQVKDGKMYAIDHGGELRVKTLYRIPGGGLRFRSFNQDEHPDEEYTADELSDREISVLGKVFWYSVLL